MRLLIFFVTFVSTVTNLRYTHSWREYDQQSCFSKKKVFALFHETVTIHCELGSVSGILILLLCAAASLLRISLRAKGVLL